MGQYYGTKEDQNEHFKVTTKSVKRNASKIITQEWARINSDKFPENNQ